MTLSTTAQNDLTQSARYRGLDLPPLLRAVIGIAGTAMTIAILAALVRAAMGVAADHSSLREIAVVIHVATVCPAVPLGLYLMLARKGGPRHKMLGRIWIALMVVTAISALFIRHLNDGGFSFIHLFVPLTLVGAWQTVTSARRGDLRAHRKHLVQLYLGALIIPGAFSFIGSRLMGAWLFG
ncbi:putative membrane protein [Sphingomonas sp. BE123]|jgi:uncharacterized membrane protein|uniref:DUF2306 domain-containing protein n=1 Tax=unclassified Sphingomonas TaxID=196159 RepID=UPI00285DE557|nr:DUF2306 domain-containing protein [Sphingomonas sp. BE123]MDR6852248.1 putative membrane protein [Sphingomonas sp. BE123]